MMELDSQQAAAVRADSRRTLVLAGAGSGKTRVLIERIGYLVEEAYVSPSEIMAFTFTRKAAGEMKSRLQERIGSKVHGITMGTMHALALRMLNQFGETVGLKSEKITVYGSWEESFLLRDVATEMGICTGKSWRIPRKAIQATFDRYYQRGIPPDKDASDYDLFNAFIARCKENNALTYGGLLVGLKILVEVLNKYLHIRHILVDEVQDIDTLQWGIILEMERLFDADLFVVGDVDQSIYEWRGAAPKYLVDHQAEFTIFRMEKNYRSDPSIVAAANNLISHNRDRITKTMIASREQAASSRVSILSRIDSEKIVSLVKAYLATAGDNPERIAVLARNHVFLKKISRTMEELGVPHQYVGKNFSLTESEMFRRFHAFLKLLVNPYDNFAFLLIRDLIGLTPVQFASIRLKAAETGSSHFQAWMASSDDNNKWFTFFNVAPEWKFASVVVGNLLNMFPDNSQFLDSADFALERTAQTPSMTVAAYLEWLATYDIQDEVAGSMAIITLLTIHAAKGLEWPGVIVAALNEGILPSYHSIAAEDVESERRLAYVAWTRARDQLILTVRPEMSDSGPEPISRFVEESKGGGK